MNPVAALLIDFQSLLRTSPDQLKWALEKATAKAISSGRRIRVQAISGEICCYDEDCPEPFLADPDARFTVCEVLPAA